jgi:hypothetical protein
MQMVTFDFQCNRSSDGETVYLMVECNNVVQWYDCFDGRKLFEAHIDADGAEDNFLAAGIDYSQPPLPYEQWPDWARGFAVAHVSRQSQATTEYDGVLYYLTRRGYAVADHDVERHNAAGKVGGWEAAMRERDKMLNIG